MSRKDFILIAATIRNLPESPEARQRIAREFANALRGTNANFDRQRFLEAAGG